MQFISSLPSYSEDTAAKTTWGHLQAFFRDEDGYCFYKHPLLPSATYDAPDLTILARDHVPVVIVIIRARYEDVGRVELDTWNIIGLPTDSPLLQLEDFVVGLRNHFTKDRHLRSIPQPLGALLFPLMSRGEVNEILSRLPADGNTYPLTFASGESLNILSQFFQMSDNVWIRAKSIFQGASVLNHSYSDSAPQDNSQLGPAINALEREIALFDDDQLRVAIQMAPGPQRIRGLAGTGKTVVLAMKAAHAHARYPEARILFTFHTQSLYNQARNLITKFYRTFRDVDPNWEQLHIRHSWGSKNKPGVYSDTCRQVNQFPLTFKQALSLDPASPLRACADHVLAFEPQPRYDYILVDEAQDFSPRFLHLLARLCAQDKRIYFAYDELQSLTSVEIPGPETLFGNGPDGEPYIKFDSDDYPGDIEKDFVLRKSYRCPRDILVFAHGIGLGIHGPNEIVQMISDRASWETLGYEVNGDLETGNDVTITRPAENSPNKIVSVYSGRQPLINIRSFNTRNEEFDWIASSVENDVKHEGVKPNAIIVISLDSRSARDFLPRIQRSLQGRGVQSVIPGFSDLASDFAEEGRVTLSTVYRAKGNEASIVYIAAFDNLYSYTDEIENRNKAFTSISRAKGWVRITGAGSKMSDVQKELELVLNDVPSLRFRFPNMSNLRIRRLDSSETSRRRKQVKAAAQIAERFLKLDPLAFEELDEDTLTKLRAMLGGDRESK